MTELNETAGNSVENNAIICTNNDLSYRRNVNNNKVK